MKSEAGWPPFLLPSNMPDITHIGQLHPDPHNARKHNPRNVQTIVNALHEVGAARSIVIDEHDVVLAGNGVVEGAAQAGIERVRVIDADGEEIIAVRRRGLTDEQKTRLALYDNRASELAEWDVDVLSTLSETDALDGLFSGDELDALLASLDKPTGAGGDDFDTTPDEGQTRVQYGNLWVLGDHRLLCGDSTKQEDVQRLMGGERANILINDPPYGMRLDADFSGMKNNLRFAQAKGVRNGRKYDNVTGDHEDYDASPIRTLFEDVKEQFWFGADYYAATLGDTMHAGAWLVWDKRLDETADRMYGSCFELIWSAQKHKRDMLRHKWAGIFGTEHEPQRGRQHPNQKPVALLEDILARYSKVVAIVWDGYLGSGTTLIAAERLGRKCYGLEIEPKYCDVILRRWEAETGREAVRIDCVD